MYIRPFQRRLCYLDFISGPAYTALTAKYLSLNDEEITNQQAFLEKCSKIPLDLQLCYRYVPEMPLGWPIDLLGVFPAEGIGIPIVIVVSVVALLIAKLLPTYTNFLALIKTKIPSGHRSITDKQAFRIPMVAFSNSNANEYLSPLLQQLMGWSCNTGKGKVKCRCPNTIGGGR